MSATLTIDATFENGVFVPDRPVLIFKEHQNVKLNVEVEADDDSPPLSEAFFVDDAIPAPLDLPYFGECRIVEIMRGEGREIDPTALSELLDLQCSNE